MKGCVAILSFILLVAVKGNSQPTVIAYYAGSAAEADSFAVEKLTHIIYSFCHLQDKQLFATFDDTTSIRLKTEYVLDKKLNGIMFWQLGEDKYRGGLLDAIDEAKRKRK